MTDAQALQGLLGEWVTVRNPDLPVSWYGRLIGLHDDPGLLLAIPGRGGTCLPQRFTVTPAEAPTAVPAAQGLPDGALDSAAAGAGMLDATAQSPGGRTLLAHALTQLARDGWLRQQPGSTWDPVPDPDQTELEPAPATEEPPRLDRRPSYEPPAGTDPDGEPLETALLAALGRPLLDRINRHLAAGQHAEQVLERVRAIPRLPHISQQTGVQGRAYTRGWESVIAMLDDALADCCVCGGAPVIYRNFKEQPFCGPCANCDCGQAVCVRTHPDARPDTSGGHAHTADVGEQTPTCLMPATSTDTVRTHPDADTADTADQGARIEYRARVRRDQVHLAIAEAFDAITRETGR